MQNAATWVCGHAENMRREGFELSVSPPRVVFKEEGGRRLEPLEEVICEVDDDQMGSVIEVCPACPALPQLLPENSGTAACRCKAYKCLQSMHQHSKVCGLQSAGPPSCVRKMHDEARCVQALSNRRAELKEMIPLNMAGKQRLVFEAPSRGLIGFRSSFATLTRGTGILHRAFSRYGPYKGPLDGVRKGVLVSTAGQRSASRMRNQHSKGSCSETDPPSLIRALMRRHTIHDHLVRCRSCEGVQVSCRWQDHAACLRQPGGPRLPLHGSGHRGLPGHGELPNVAPPLHLFHLGSAVSVVLPQHS